jgi:mono/diheme cytochrome c family protein
MRRRSALTAALLVAFGAVAHPAGGETARTLYLLKCSGCHRADGQGAADAGVPPFPGFIADLARDPGGRTYMLHVPGVASSGLNDADLTAVLNYLLDRWSGAPAADTKPFTPQEVAALRAVPVNNIVTYRRTLVARLRKSGAAIAEYPWP